MFEWAGFESKNNYNKYIQLAINEADYVYRSTGEIYTVEKVVERVKFYKKLLEEGE